MHRVARAASEEDFAAAIRGARELPVEQRREVVAEVVRREAGETSSRRTAHRVQEYARHLPPNPRTIKRFVNAYEIARALDRVEGRDVSLDQRAIWTLIRLRWPLLADALEEDAGVLDRLPLAQPVPGAPGPPEPDAHALLRRADVLRVVGGFGAADVRACCGILSEEAVREDGEAVDSA